jgi:transcriptional regulator GlxA family with amidase domain
MMVCLLILIHRSQVLDYIRVNLRENITLKNLSEKACMSTSFYRFFKRELGMSPIEFVISEKLKCAKQLLKTYNTNKRSYLSVLKTVITSSVYLKA